MGITEVSQFAAGVLILAGLAFWLFGGDALNWLGRLLNGGREYWIEEEPWE